MAQINYNVDENDLEQSVEAVPAGGYIAVIESSEYVSTKENTGKILKLTYQIIDGQMKGRKIFENLNLENKNKQAEQIARRTLNSIGVATGIKEIKDSAMLHNIPMNLDVTVKENPEYGRQNRIKKHSPYKKTNTEIQQPANQPEEIPAPVKSPWDKE